jgi:hypothetical protein
MGCRLGWRLLARGNLLLDAGDIGSDFENRRSAIEALTGLLVTFPIWGRVDEEDYWWARRSSETDFEIRFVVH